MMRIDFQSGAAMTVAIDVTRTRRRPPLVNLRAIGASGTTLLFVLKDHEVLALVRALLAGGDAAKLPAEERAVLARYAERRAG